MGWVFGSEEEVDGGTGDDNWSEISVTAWKGKATGPEEETGLEEGKETSVEVIKTLKDWCDIGKEERTEGNASETPKKEEGEELDKRLEIQRYKGGWTEEDKQEESEWPEGIVGKLDSLKITWGVI